MVSVDPRALHEAAQAACRAALRAGLGEHEACDLAQDALIRALCTSRPPEGVALSAWVYGIARNLGRDHAKSAQRREMLVEATPEGEVDVDVVTQLAVRRALDELPDELRAVITLHELEEHSLKETALALGIPFDTAKDRLRRARTRLRDHLGEDAMSTERTLTRRRAARHSAAIVAGLAALLASSTDALAAPDSTTKPANATKAVARRLGARGWGVVGMAGLCAIGGFAVGRITAPPSVRSVHDDVALVARPTDVGGPTSPAKRVDVATPAIAASAPTTAAATPPPPPASTPPPVASSARRALEPHVPQATNTGNVLPSDALASERLLIERARTGLQRGLVDEALVTLMTHERRYPAGALGEERDVLLIDAYLRAGKPTLAQRRIERYRAEHTTGVLRARVDALAARVPTTGR
ncbi:MAG: sigma-70 family RNA polymerase sigma factor [Kofleriaceae bacterium]|nr:sigma-70 family RNA polymerase sigma factor [Kofleriaceae bacterium]